MSKIRTAFLIVVVILVCVGCGERDSKEQTKASVEQKDEYREEKLGKLSFHVNQSWKGVSESLITDGDGLNYQLNEQEYVKVFYLDWTATRSAAEKAENKGKKFKINVESQVEEYLTGRLSPATIEFKKGSKKTDNYKYKKHSGKTSNVNRTYQVECYYKKVDDYNIIAVIYVFGEKSENRKDFDNMLKSMKVVK